MWYSKILVAYDGSAPSKKAVDIACQMAQADPAVTVVFAHALRIGASAMSGFDLDGVLLANAEQVKEHLQKIADTLPNQTEVVILKGTSPADLITTYCDKNGCDLIVMGSRGMGGVKGYLGSVSHTVVCESKVCVLIAKTDDKDERA